VHAEWAAKKGDALVLHPHASMRIVDVAPGRWLIAHAPADEESRARSEPWAESTWAFFVESLGPKRSRVVSRFRAACSDDLPTRLGFGPTLLEPIGFVMDREMLLGVKQRAERARAEPPHVTLQAPVVGT